jgi:CRP-like cAMP-binding protein
MHESLITYIKNHSTTPLSETDIEVIKDVFIPKKFRKRQFFLQEGEVSKYTAFIVKGSMRQYSVDDKGVEHTVGLFIENSWARDRESLTTGTPSIYFIDAWEETNVLMLSISDNNNILIKIPAFAEMRTELNDTHHFNLQKRLHTSISLSAEQRYQNLMENSPEILQRFPQHIIASYLGIAKETLSRIRGNAIRK